MLDSVAAMDTQRLHSEFHIPVPHRALKIALTAPDWYDRDASSAGLNDPKVYMNLNGPPYPYTDKDWEIWYAMIVDLWNQNQADLQAIKHQDQDILASQDWSQRKWLGHRMWHCTIRDISGDSEAPISGRFMGDITVGRETFHYILDNEERQKRKEQNDKLEPGDPRIVWMIGCKFLCAQKSRSGTLGSWYMY